MGVVRAGCFPRRGCCRAGSANSQIAIPRRRPAYTLFELILVLALLVVITTLIYPSLDAMYGDYRLTQATDQVRAAWANARSSAMDQGRPYRFAIVPGRGNFRVAPDSAEFWAGNAEPAAQAEQLEIPYVQEDALPRQVRFASAEAVLAGLLDQTGETVLLPGTIEPSMWLTTATFLPDGSSREDVELIFHSRGCRPILLQLRALTGVVTPKTLPAGSLR